MLRDDKEQGSECGTAGRNGQSFNVKNMVAEYLELTLIGQQ